MKTEQGESENHLLVPKERKKNVVQAQVRLGSSCCGCGSCRGRACCHAGIGVIDFFMSVEVRVKKGACESIYGQRHFGEKRIVQSPAMIAAADPLSSRGVPFEISDQFLGSPPTQFESAQTLVGE